MLPIPIRSRIEFVLADLNEFEISHTGRRAVICISVKTLANILCIHVIMSCRVMLCMKQCDGEQL